MMRKIGIALIIIGLTFSGYQLYSWFSARQSAEALTQKEMKKYESVDKPVDDQSSKKETAMKPIEKKKIEPPSFKEGEKMAELIIPKMEKKFSVYWGTDEKALKKGVGMYSNRKYTVTPGEKGHVVLSGHRDTVFVGLDSIQPGDKLAVKMKNKVYWYVVEKHWITDKGDRSVIVPTENERLTLTTCYPFDYFGRAPERYIIQAKRI
ncbi:class D sortase [Fictibacillus fluitans]|uniref:Class D sortase n=1 Tax=Fictibacillus fluitans TaxID=3058422 RepID=A0ABT8HVT9_9BACL|nr:class D sortase [Fictibacillus sp. NE201]MDN4524880.1 class D sortase [Fictibacillus sp. NE201]